MKYASQGHEWGAAFVGNECISGCACNSGTNRNEGKQASIMTEKAWLDEGSFCDEMRIRNPG